MPHPQASPAELLWFLLTALFATVIAVGDGERPKPGPRRTRAWRRQPKRSRSSRRPRRSTRRASARAREGRESSEGESLLPERAAATAADAGFSGDAAMGRCHHTSDRRTLANFEGLSNQDNFNVFGFRVNPPDPVGDVARTTTSR